MVKKMIQKILRQRYSYTPLVEIQISKSRLLHNFHLFRKINPDVMIAPVLKSNAYGHGLTIVAKIVDSEVIPFIIVDSYHEAMILRNEGVKSEIVVIGYTAFDNIHRSKLRNVSFTIVSMDELEEIAQKLTRPVNFHLKIDTGMHRQGILVEDTARAIKLIKTNSAISIIGICSHLADADGEKREGMTDQIKIWNALIGTWQKEFPLIKYFHLAATTGMLFSKNIRANVARLGAGLYGIDPSDEKLLIDLKPVLEMKSVLSGTKTINTLDRVGYGGTFVVPATMRVGTIPAGYYEGIDRGLSNKGFVKISDIFCPIIGLVSMNITTIDISKIPEVKFGTAVVIISQDPQDKNSIQNISALVGIQARELLVQIPQGLRRKVVQ